MVSSNVLEKCVQHPIECPKKSPYCVSLPYIAGFFGKMGCSNG